MFRRLISVAAAALLASTVLVAVAVTPADAATKAQTKIVLTVPNTVSLVGSYTTVTGKLTTRSGTAIKAARITLQEQSSKWVNVSTTKTSSRGAFSVRIRNTKTGRHNYRVEYAGSASADAHTQSFSLQPYEPTTVTITRATSSTGAYVEAGKKFTLSGTTSANLDGQMLHPFEKINGRWTELGGGTKVANRKFAMTFTATGAAGDQYYDVAYLGSNTLAENDYWAELDQLQWFALSVPPALSGATANEVYGCAAVGCGNILDLTTQSTGTATYPLYGRCVEFTGVAKANYADATLEVQGDSQATGNVTYSLSSTPGGATTPLAVTTLDAQKLVLTLSTATGQPVAQGSSGPTVELGNLQALCDRAP